MDGGLASTLLYQTTLEFYQLFSNSVSYTLAASVVESYVTSNENEMVTLMFTLCFLAVLLIVINNEISARYRSIDNDNIAKLVAGPVGLAVFLTSVSVRILVHFMATVMGRWILTLSPENTNIYNVGIGLFLAMSMVWLLGASVGLIPLPDRESHTKKTG